MAQSSDVADVLIIGSGASGGPFAWSLSRVGGIKVVCLEQGDWVQSRQTLAEIRRNAVARNPESEDQRQRLTNEPPRESVRSFADGYPYDYSDSYWQPILGNAVGGATLHYSAVWARLHPSDFVVRSLDGVADDWPITYWDLAPYYDLNDNFVGVAGVPGNPAYPPKSVDLMPPHKSTQPAEILARGFNNLGWHWWPTETAMITVPHGGRSPCPTNCTTCHDGCPRQAKNSSDVVFWPQAVRNGVVLKTRATVREVTVDNQGLATGALYYDGEGRLNEQKARIVVLACNGIGTPRLLLNSKSRRFPQGLANSSGQVGKNLMGHPGARVTGLFEHETVAPNRQLSNGIASEEFYESDPGRGFARGFWWLSTGYTGPINVALGEPPDAVATVIPATLRNDRGPDAVIPWGATHHAAFQELYAHTTGMGVLCEELPIESNRVELHSTLTDDLGIPAVKLVYRRSENTEKILAFAIERSKELLSAAGATEINAGRLTTAAPGHYLGTARMGNDPARSVVDRWCRAHDVRNLFVIDGSVFTTSGSTVPTSTIQAIALRTADYVKNNAKELLVGE